MQEGFKILVIDIETRPALSYHWRMFKENISPVQVKEDPSILCVCAKWVGESEVFTYSEWEDGYVNMLKNTAILLDQSDAVVTKNGEKFDIPWLFAEFLKHGIPMPPPLTHIDLEKTIKKQFRFLSNKMEYVAPYIGVGKKVKHEGFELWRKVMDGNAVARRKMLRYCAGDVRVTERMYKKMRQFITNHPHMGTTYKRHCGACGSKKVWVSKWRRTKAMRIQQLHCQNCGSYFDGVRQKVTA